jgi:hypothetical protein
MNQKTQFKAPENWAPDDWVAAVEAAVIGNAQWIDTSWGNDAAPSWMLVDSANPDRAFYVAFYYTAANDDRPDDSRHCYVGVTEMLENGDFGEDHCEATPAQFLAALSASSPADFFSRLKYQGCNECYQHDRFHDQRCPTHPDFDGAPKE